MIKRIFLTNILYFISRYKFLSNIFSLLLILIVNLYNLRLLIKKKTIKGIALSHTRFRQDIDHLNKSSELSIYKLPLKYSISF
jgi:hypothetical protein